MAPTWRELGLDDIDALMRVADVVHKDLPEAAQVFAERVKLFPKGCLALVNDGDDQLCGYAISHPIRQRQPPALDSLLGELAPDADQYYIHDMAILPGQRGGGLARACIERLLGVASSGGYPSACLVSVYGTEGFWGRFEFKLDDGEDMKEKLTMYGDDAKFMVRSISEK